MYSGTLPSTPRRVNASRIPSDASAIKPPVPRCVPRQIDPLLRRERLTLKTAVLTLWVNLDQGLVVAHPQQYESLCCSNERLAAVFRLTSKEDYHISKKWIKRAFDLLQIRVKLGLLDAT
jgi:hypothetical protein